jgi:hypothetical protein
MLLDMGFSDFDANLALCVKFKGNQEQILNEVLK